MTPDGLPLRRVSDSGDPGMWTAVDELRVQMRAIAPVATVVAQHDAELDALKDSLTRHERLVREGFARVEADTRERFDRAFAKLDAINAHVQRTNGRVTALEKESAVEEALREAAAAVVEERRKTVALRIAEHGWIRPSIAGGVVALMLMLADRLIPS